MKSNDTILTRRTFLKQSSLAAAWFGIGISAGGKLSEASVKNAVIQESSVEKSLYWGDIHNHNAVGYAKGSLERSYDIAKRHLDFYCFTGHSQWHDMPIMPQNKHMKWVRGFEVMKNNWEKVVRLANDSYKPNEFVSFLGYEWHSSMYGDVCIIFPDSRGDLVYKDSIQAFQQFARERGAILIPHHPAYLQGWRGQNWSVLDTSLSPVLEIFSEHGNAETDRVPHRYIRHSMGGRYTRNTLEWLLKQGAKIGVVASTDDHLGYPGAYGEGMMAAYANELTRDSIFEAIQARRTYGVSADRIKLDFRLNGHWMGEAIPATPTRNITISTEGKDQVDRVEILRNEQVIHRHHPIDLIPDRTSWQHPVLCRVEFGWGPWGDLNMDRICDWQFSVRVDGGNLEEVTPCFQAGPFDEDRRNYITRMAKNNLNVISYTSRKQAFEETATNSVILKINGTPDTNVNIKIKNPVEKDIIRSLSQLAESSDIVFTGPFTSESMLIHRLVFEENYKAAFEFTDETKSNGTDWYRVRVMQSNESFAWSSPIWVG